jgi:hypothetical protein
MSRRQSQCLKTVQQGASTRTAYTFVIAKELLMYDEYIEIDIHGCGCISENYMSKK